MSDLIKLSVSKSATFNSCKKKYEFTYIHKIPRQDWSFHTFGRFVHRVLELFHLKYLEGATDTHGKVMSTSFKESLEEVEFKGKIDQKTRQEAFDILKIYLAKLAIDPKEVSRITAVEKTFNLQINESLILTGMIDRVQFDDDGIHHVLDYKTSKSKEYLKNDTLQLLTYAYVIYTENPELKKVRVSYIMLRHDCEFITKEFELDEILSVKSIYEKYENDIRNEKEYPSNPTRLCLYCNGLSLCEDGRTFLSKGIKHGHIKWGKSK